MRILALSDVADERTYASVGSRVGNVDLILGCGDLPYEYLDYVADLHTRVTNTTTKLREDRPGNVSVPSDHDIDDTLHSFISYSDYDGPFLPGFVGQRISLAPIQPSRLCTPARPSAPAARQPPSRRHSPCR